MFVYELRTRAALDTDSLEQGLRLEGAPISGLSDAWVPATDGPPPAADDSCPTAPPTPSGLRSPRVPVLVKDGPAFCT
ncbi:unnamed protein product [Lampetra planeri]